MLRGYATMNATKELLKEKEHDIRKTKTEMADAHCHLNMIDEQEIRRSIDYGVLTIITNGIDTASNMRNMELADGKHIYVAAGIDPETAMKIGDDELKFNIDMIKSNKSRIKAIGEIGLDFMKATEREHQQKQKMVFEDFLDLSKELSLPVSIHSRNAMDDVLKITKKKGVEKVHLHFFEGDVNQAKEAEKRGYMISIPPLESSKRKKVIKEVSMQTLMVESDSPVVGKAPIDVEKALAMIADLKGVSFDVAAATITANTKKFFNIGFQGIRR
jgi:TatD DNase family protein